MEQALSLPSATLRFAQLGWRVIRIEATPSGNGLPGDPNRYIGSRVADEDRRSYFIAPNVGKEAVALNLKDARGKQVLERLITALDVDMFCCNTVPSRYKPLGIDYATLSAMKPDLIWAGISAMGPDYPETPGYDPVIQAMCGYMEVTGDPTGPPTVMGLPVIDLKAGDEVYANVLLALLERHETGRGKAIHVSMLQAAASWLITVLPLIDFGCEPNEITRAGNRHRKFIPTNVYPAADGFVYLAIGSDVQWKRLTDSPKFASIANSVRATERRPAHRTGGDPPRSRRGNDALPGGRDLGRSARGDDPSDANFRRAPGPRAAAAARQADADGDAAGTNRPHATGRRRCAGRIGRAALSAKIRFRYASRARRGRLCRAGCGCAGCRRGHRMSAENLDFNHSRANQPALVFAKETARPSLASERDCRVRKASVPHAGH